MKKTLSTPSIPYLSDYKRGLAWTLIDSLGGQGLVILFHILYRSFTSEIDHGVMGCILSLVYLCTTITNLGLDKSLAPFFERLTKTRQDYSFFIGALLIPQMIILCMLSTAAYFLLPFFVTIFPFLSSLDSHLFSIILATFITEGIRKTVRTLIRLAFYFKFAAVVELAGTVSIVCGIVITHWLGLLTLRSTWVLMLTASSLQLLVQAGTLMLLGSTLSKKQSTSDHKKLFLSISKTRIFTWILHSLNQLYSGNFLVPVCALKFGIASASMMQVISSISYWITLLAQKVFGVSSNALLAHIKSRSSETQTTAFNFLTDVFNQGIYALLIFLLINGQGLARMNTNVINIQWPLLYYMLLLTFFESFFVLYEKWYILEEDTATYLAFNSVSIGLLYLIVPILSSPITILLLILSVRIATYIALSIFSFYRWAIWPSFRPRWPVMLAALSVSLAYYLIF